LASDAHAGADTLATPASGHVPKIAQEVGQSAPHVSVVEPVQQPRGALTSLMCRSGVKAAAPLAATALALAANPIAYPCSTCEVQA
jgi:hypothetical protein